MRRPPTILPNAAQVLAGLTLVFTRVIPLEQEPATHPLWRMAESFGARCSTVLDAATTHLIAAASGTEKVLQASAEGRGVLRGGRTAAKMLLMLLVGSVGSGMHEEASGHPFTPAAGPCCLPPWLLPAGARLGQVGRVPRLAGVQLHAVEARQRGALPGAALSSSCRPERRALRRQWRGRRPSRACRAARLQGS